MTSSINVRDEAQRRRNLSQYIV